MDTESKKTVSKQAGFVRISNPRKIDVQSLGHALLVRDEKKAGWSMNSKENETVSESKVGSAQRMDDFVRLLAANQQRIYLYLSSLLSGHPDVDDLFQETNMICWREFSNFTPGTNFGAWACSIAFNRVRAWRKKQSREHLRFSDEFLSAISDELIEHEELYSDRADALAGCMKKLPQHHRELLQQRYTCDESIDSLARKLRRKPDAIYRMLSRIRSSLHECVNQTIQLQES